MQNTSFSSAEVIVSCVRVVATLPRPWLIKKSRANRPLTCTVGGRMAFARSRARAAVELPTAFARLAPA